jgi:toxin CcdB
MPQFSVHKNKNVKTRDAFPYLVDVQSNLLSDLQTRVVVPAAKVSSLARRPLSNLTPVVEIERHKYVLLVPQMAGISRTELGQEIADLSRHRQDIVGAIDFLITGI